MKGTTPTRKPVQSDGFTKWLRSGGVFSRWWKEAIITTPVVGLMAFYGILRYRVDFSWPLYFGATIAISAAVALYFALVSMKKFPEPKSVLDPTAPEFSAPIEPK